MYKTKKLFSCYRVVSCLGLHFYFPHSPFFFLILELLRHLQNYSTSRSCLAATPHKLKLNPAEKKWEDLQNLIAYQLENRDLTDLVLQIQRLCNNTSKVPVTQ